MRKVLAEGFLIGQGIRNKIPESTFEFLIGENLFWFYRKDISNFKQGEKVRIVLETVKKNGN